MSGFPSRHGDDSYHELASIRANTQASVAFQALQTGLLAGMSQSMNAIHHQMDMVRQQQDEALSIQQELLKQEQIQSHLEEFVFQAEKLVVECSKDDTDIPPSSRYFVLMGVLGKIRSEGIGTPIIRGRENKSAFEKVVKQTQALTQQLESDPEVQEAIEWAEAERRRIESEQQKAGQERQKMIKKLRQKLAALKGELVSIKTMDVVREKWGKIDTYLGSKLAPWQKTAVQIAGGTAFLFTFYPPLGVLIWCWFQAKKQTEVQNRDRVAQISKINNRIASLIEGADE
jgi:DNA repair exonuclease SbcCD ATPase subunit